MINAERFAKRILSSSGSLIESASWFCGTEAAELSPLDAARVAVAMMSAMRGGQVGDDRAVPEMLYVAFHVVAINGPGSVWPEDSNA